MDFFAQQDKAHHKTKLLVFYFVLAVVAIVVAAYFAALFLFGLAQTRAHPYTGGRPSITLWNARLFLDVAIGVLAVIFFGSLYKRNELAGGGGAVAALMGGRLLHSNTADPNERKLLNVVEEMSIASGVPVPKVYVLDSERGINAFAAGHSTSDAAIGVTRGCVELLSRDQLQGVIGHEFSHILNGDMRLNLRLIGIIFGILCLATIGRILLYTRGGGRDGRGNALPLLGLVLLLLGAIGVFFGRLIQAAVSRQREFLADASSVQFTRNPAGLSGALQKIGGYTFGSRLQSHHAPDLCHMFFGNGVREPLFHPMATHPPLPERIRAIDPAWNGNFPPLKPEEVEVAERAAAFEPKRPPRPPFPPIFGMPGGMAGAILAGAGAEAERPPVLKPHAVLPYLGNPTPLHLRYAEQLRDSLPDSVKAAAREPADAVALIGAMLLSDDEKLRATQLAEIARRFSPGVSTKAAALFPDVSAAAKHAHLPMINLAIGALRHLSAPQFQRFSQMLQWLIESDGKTELFEFVLQKIVRRHLAPQFGAVKRLVIQYYSVKPLAGDCAVLLSALARAGSGEADKISKAFEAGAPYLRAPGGVGLQLLPRDQCGVSLMDPALNRLAQASPLIKKNLLDACVHVVGADGVIQEPEAELLRAIADTLDCPMPPFAMT